MNHMYLLQYVRIKGNILLHRDPMLCLATSYTVHGHATTRALAIIKVGGGKNQIHIQ